MPDRSLERPSKALCRASLRFAQDRITSGGGCAARNYGTGRCSQRRRRVRRGSGVRLSRVDCDRPRPQDGWRWNPAAEISLGLDPRFQACMQAGLSVVDRSARPGRPGNLWNPAPHRPVLGSLKDCRVGFHSMPAFLRIAFASPIGTSRLSACKGIVTVGRVGCW
jgi:hypothetical protein